MHETKAGIIHSISMNHVFKHIPHSWVYTGLIQTALAKQWIQNESPIRVFKGLTDVMYHHTFLPPAYAVETVMHAITAPAGEVRAPFTLTLC